MPTTRALPTARVTARRDVTPDLFVLHLSPDVDFVFAPGQYCTIGVGGVERPYSIVSAPHEPELELIVELVPGGALTPRLAGLRPGDVVTLRPRPKGVFTLQARWPVHLMVATVTGIAPFVSMLRDARHRDVTASFHVLHGASHHDELVYREELEANPLCTYVPTVSRPGDPRNAGWHGHTGRVDTLLDGALVRHGLTPASTRVYACGHPGMIADVTARLAPRGFTVAEERFWTP
jgi:NAD(P)H-flavin reductase